MRFCYFAMCILFCASTTYANPKTAPDFAKDFGIIFPPHLREVVITPAKEGDKEHLFIRHRDPLHEAADSLCQDGHSQPAQNGWSICITPKTYTLDIENKHVNHYQVRLFHPDVDYEVVYSISGYCDKCPEKALYWARYFLNTSMQKKVGVNKSDFVFSVKTGPEDPRVLTNFGWSPTIGLVATASLLAMFYVRHILGEFHILNTGFTPLYLALPALITMAINVKGPCGAPAWACACGPTRAAKGGIAAAALAVTAIIKNSVNDVFGMLYYGYKGWPTFDITLEDPWKNQANTSSNH